jgi:2-amino-4-hydroxy-6-hydroxymethyldihydropteridine diphosphokinase
MNTAFLLTGGNLGDRLANLSHAQEYIRERCGDIVAASNIYETAAWGRTDQPSFLNQALKLNTTLLPHRLLATVLDIERIIGRIRGERYGPRLMDIDILLYNAEIIDLPQLKIPHPQLPKRRFALTPLAEIAADFMHPVSGKSIAELLSACADNLPVTRINL